MFREHEVLPWRRYAAQASARPGETIALSGMWRVWWLVPITCGACAMVIPPAFVPFAQGKEGGVTPPHYLSLFGPAFHECAAQYARASDEQFRLARPFPQVEVVQRVEGGTDEIRIEFAFSFRRGSPGRIRTSDQPVNS
jgi:hypothetical protein